MPDFLNSLRHIRCICTIYSPRINKTPDTKTVNNRGRLSNFNLVTWSKYPPPRPSVCVCVCKVAGHKCELSAETKSAGEKEKKLFCLKDES